MAVQQRHQINISTPEVISQYGLVVKKMLSAGAAASVAEVTTIPIDTSKVRLQVNHLNVHLFPNAPVKLFCPHPPRAATGSEEKCV